MATQLQEILDARAYYKEYYSGMHQRFETVDAFYRGDYKIRKAKLAEPYKPATAKRKVDYATDMCMTIGPRVIVPEWSQAQKAKDLAQKLQRFGQAFIEHPDFVKVKRDLIKHGNTYGMFCRQGPIYLESEFPKKPSLVGLYGDERKQAIEEYEEKRSQAFPIRQWAINPQCIYPDPSDLENPPCVMKIVMRKAGILKKMYPDVKLLADYKDETDVEWTEWWTAKEYAYLVKDELATDGVIKNWMGYIPFDIGYGGLGFESVDSDPAERAVGLIYHSMSAFIAEATMKTAVMDHVVREFEGRERIAAEPGTAGPYHISTDGSPDVIAPAYQYTVDRPPALSGDTLTAIEMVGSDIEKQTYSPVMEGRNPIGQAPTSGYDRAQMTAADRINLAGIVRSYEVLEGRGLDKVAILGREVIPEALTILGFKGDGTVQETVKPDEWAKVHFKVKLDGKSPEEIDQRMQLGLNLWKNQAISWETMVKDYFGMDPEIERNKLLAERAIDNSPILQEAMAQKALQILGVEQQQQMAEDVARIREKQASKPPDINQPMEGMRTQQRLGSMGVPRQMGTPMEQGAPV